MSLVKQEHHLQVFRCDPCGELIYSRVYPVEQLARPERVQVLFTWRHAVPTSRDAVLVRRLCPSAGSIPVSELRQKLEADGIWEAGIFPNNQAMELGKKAEELGLRVEYK